MSQEKLLKSLAHDIALEARDASGKGDRVAAGILTQVARAIERNAARQTETASSSQEAESIEQAAAKAASKKVN